MQNYIFSIGLIPVQEFIAEARRSRDLRTGSAILSYLMVKMIKAIKEDMKAKIIIPIDDSFNDKIEKKLSEFISHPDYSIPNRASGYCCTNENDNLETIFNQIQNNITSKFWQDYLDKDEKDQLQKDLKKYFGDIKLNTELPFQLIWVAIPVDSDFEGRKKEGKVEEDLKNIGEFFDNVKNTRPIKPWTHGAPIGKCTQCGKREAICPEDKKNDFKAWWKWYQNIVKHPDIKTGFKFEASERLCDICAFKRLLSYVTSVQQFPSTNAIAIKHWLNILSQNWTNELQVKYACFKELFDSIKDDQQVAFYKRDYKDIIERVKINIPSSDEKKLKQKFNGFNKDVSDFIIQKKLPISTNPPNYLSVIVYDGDDIGKNVQKYVNELPAYLFEFQKVVKQIIKDNEAEAFYTGGDEGLILCPIETTLKLAISIRKKFKELFRSIDDSITLSMGIIIFDRSRPMGTAIKQAQHLLDQAKKQMKGKNALAIGVQTASGNQWLFRAHWGADWDRIENILVHISNGVLSKGWAFEMEEFARSMPEDVMQYEDMRNAMISELKRISWRKFDHKKDCELSRLEKKEDAFKKLWKDSTYSNTIGGDKWMSNIQDYPDLQFWANQFHLIGFLSKYHIV